MKKIFSVEINNFSVKNIIDNQFLSLDLYAISDGQNRNDSVFMLDGMEKSISSFYQKPILAYFNPIVGEVEEHNSRLAVDEFGDEYWDYQYDGAEKAVGVIPTSANISIVEKDGKKWIYVEDALIWTEYNRQLVQLLKKQKKKKVSVEIEITKSHTDGEIEIIEEFVILGITILGKFPDGKEVLEGIEGANLTIKDFSSSETFAKFKRKMSFAMSNSNKNDILSKYRLDENTHMDLSMNEIRGRIEAILSKYFYDYGESQYRKYWLYDIVLDESVAIIHDEEDGFLYAVCFHILEDDVVLDFETIKKASTKYVYSGTNEKHEYSVSKDVWGTGDSVEVDKTKESVSSDAWSSVNKTKLRNDILTASNYKTLVKSAYLVVEDGWEDSPSSKLKYPVMQLKDGKLVYNANGLLSAQQYGEKYDEAAATKAKRLRKKLGLLGSEKREKMNKFIEKAKDAGLVFLGTFGGKLTFAKEADEEDEKKEMSVYEIEKEKAEKMECPDGEEFKCDDLKEMAVKPASDDAEKEELRAKCMKLEKEAAEKDAELKEIKMKKMKEDTEKILSDEDEIDDDDKEDLRKMRDEDKFSDTESFIREMSYRKYKAYSAKKSEKSITIPLVETFSKKNHKPSGLDLI